MEKSYAKGILGAILGGLVASLPWILAYVYGNMIIAALAIIIAIGALKGYQILNGKVDKKLPIIIAIVSLLCVTVSTLVIIPLLLLLKEGVGASLTNLELLYSDSEFFAALMGDYIISVLFTILGMSGVIKTIKTEIENSKDKDNIKVEIGNGTKQDREKIIQYFLTKNAVDANTATEIEETAELNENALAALIQNAVIVKKGDKYYYSFENDEKNKKAEKKSAIFVGIFIAILVGLMVFFGFSDSKENEIDTSYRAPKDITFEISDQYIEHTEEGTVNEWYYLHKNDIAGGTGSIYVSYFEGELTFDKETLSSVKASLESISGVQKVTEGKQFKTSSNYDAIEYVMTLKDYTTYAYYIAGPNYVACVEIADYNKIDNLLEDGKKLVDTLKWKK
ncbi:MAG: hypothetical protein E7171_02205 [Firmicutes bacterium]|nr:hypothetical protein [Bacillota bacterium]